MRLLGLGGALAAGIATAQPSPAPPSSALADFERATAAFRAKKVFEAEIKHTSWTKNLNKTEVLSGSLYWEAPGRFVYRLSSPRLIEFGRNSKETWKREKADEQREKVVRYAHADDLEIVRVLSLARSVGLDVSSATFAAAYDVQSRDGAFEIVPKKASHFERLRFRYGADAWLKEIVIEDVLGNRTTAEILNPKTLSEADPLRLRLQASKDAETKTSGKP